MMSTYNNFSKGSEWLKCDLHFHTPSSYDYHDKSVTDEEIIKTLTENNINVVCITDHNVMDVERIKNLQILGSGKVTVLPGIEFCSELGGSESIHFIGIFPENIDLESTWTKLQGKLYLTPKDIEDKGGYENIQCDLIDTCDLIHELNGLTSIHAGSKTNTVENIKNNLLIKMEQKKRILSECVDILEIGKQEDINDYESIVFKNIKFRLPMIICSDNHNIKDYKVKCNCWIKSAPAFDGLRQILYEPKTRVLLRNKNPDLYRENCIESITVEKDWFPQKILPLNKGLVSIIGARGSGKTALLDFIALGSRAYYKYKASFLAKAKKEVYPLTVKINLDNSEISQNFEPELEYFDPLVKYLSQQFVEDLCSENGSTERLQAEIERFIFENINGVERMGTGNFSELKHELCKSSEAAINACKYEISNLNNEISRIYHLQKKDLPEKEKEKLKLSNELKVLENRLPMLNKTVQNESIREHETINNQKIVLENELKNEWAQITKLQQIHTDILLFEKTIAEKNQYFKNELIKLDVDEQLLSKLDIQYYNLFANDISNVIDRKKKKFYERYGNEESPIENTYQFLKQKQGNIQQKMNQYTEDEQHYLKISKDIEQTKIELAEIEKQINSINALNTKEVQKERLKLYKKIFEEMIKQKNILETLYSPLIERLKENKQEEKLGFFVKINVDIESWAIQGEKLIDLRKAREIHPHKNIIDLANDKLYNSWVNCDLSCIEKTMDGFYTNEANKMSKILIDSSSIVKLAQWLFSTDHISISYEMTFDGVPLNQLSPGTKGILLMLLYLGVDRSDNRPLLIDQPEDNLDPESVYSVLVPYFAEAKKRRQIIMVTHNPNLVVATDSDQVIIATCETKEVGSLPTFTYFGGGLENPEIVAKTCSILEGGEEEAFRKREIRYFGHRKRK